MNYDSDIRIDESALDVEWLEQPTLMMKYAHIFAKAREALDQKKEAFELVKAELDKKIRSNPSRYGIEKITEATVVATIISQQDYKDANTDVISAKFDADIAQAAVRAVDARKDALENLVRLHGQQYFAGPKIPRDLAWERAEKQKKINASIASKITRRTR